jgi:hypothetical protein
MDGMRRVSLNDDPQSSDWWLASDGKWYPPDLHPSVRSSALDDEDRFAALFDAAIGVARVRENVVAQVAVERRTRPSSTANGNDTHPGPQLVNAGRRASDHGLVRHGSEPPPRFRTRDTTNWTYEAREPSTDRPRAETRQRPGTRERPSLQPPSWSPAAYGRPTPPSPAPEVQSQPPRPQPQPEARPDLSWPPARAASTAPPTPATTWQPPERAEPGWPPDRTARSWRPPPPPPEHLPATTGFELEAEAALEAEVEPVDHLTQEARTPASVPVTPEYVAPEPSPAPATPLEAVPPEAVTPAEAVTLSAAAPPTTAPDAPVATLPTPAESSTLPPTARRRSSERDLRQAVAGAVARAAAQGPLVPASADDHGPVLPQEDVPAQPWPKSRRRPAPFGHGRASSAPVAPMEPSAGEREVLTTPAEAIVEQQALDPYEEFVRLAGEHALAAIAPRRYTDREPVPEPESEPESEAQAPVPAPQAPASTAPTAAPESDALAEQPPPNTEQQEQPDHQAQDVEPTQDVERSPLWLTSRSELSPMDIATRAMPIIISVDVENGEQPAPDPYEQFAVLAREHAENEIASRHEALGPSIEPAQAGPARLEEISPEQTLDPALVEPSDQLAPDLAPDPDPDLAPDPDSELHDAEETPWPIGERRSAARQARKPLPAALQAAVASGVTPPGSTASASQRSASRQDRGPVDGLQDGSNPGTNDPGIIRRYASAIAVVAIFVAAGGAAAGIAALRGPIAPPATQTPAQDRAQANAAVLRARDFPAGWAVSVGAASSSFGVGSVLVTPSIVHFWLTAHPGCATTLGALSSAMMPLAGSPTAVGSTHGVAGDRLGATWQIADVIAFHSTSAQVGSQVAFMRSLLAGPNATACVGQFWTAALLAELPPGSHVTMHVSPAAISGLPGNPPLWAMSMSGIATVRNVALPIFFEVAQLEAQRAEVTLVASAKVAPLTGGLDQRLLVRLATRAEKFGH